MRKFYLLITLVFILPISLLSQNKADTLTNAKIIQFTKIGLEPSIIINKIKLSKFISFDISDNGLKNLKDNSVATEVIIEMMNSDAQKQTIAENYKDPKDPHSMHPIGIYFYNPYDTSKLLTKLYPTVASGIKSGGGSYSVHGFSFGGGGTESIISGSESHTQLKEPNPTFYFYFDNKATQNAENWQFATAASPNEFVLVKLLEKTDRRILVIGKSSTVMGSHSNTTGIPEKDKIQFTITPEAEGIFRITINQPLPPGEYCFLYASSISNMFTNDKIFDFGVQGEYGTTKKIHSNGDYKGKYFMLGTGYGTSYGGFGLRAQGRFGRKAGFGIHTGFGLSSQSTFNANIGFKFFMYKNFYLDMQFGTLGYKNEYGWDMFGNDFITKKKTYGPSFLIGGDWVWGKKIAFGFNTAFGFSYIANYTDMYYQSLLGNTYTNITYNYLYHGSKRITLAFDLGFLVRF